MGDNRHTLVLFPGSWGNNHDKFVKWWFRHVIAYFTDWDIVVLTYEGKTLNEYVQNSVAKLSNVPDQSYAICYSAGAQVARGVCKERPEIFRKVTLISGLERFGIRFSVFLRALGAAFRPLIRCLFGKPLQLDTLKQVKVVLMGGTSERDTKKLSEEIWSRRMHPEPSRVALSLTLPLIRKRMPPLPCPVLAFMPDRDFFVAKATYPGEDVQKVRPSGDHTLICGAEIRLRSTLQRIRKWFLT